MTTSRDPDRLFASWMAEGPETLRDDVLAGVSAEVRRTPQHRGLRRRWARLPGLAARRGDGDGCRRRAGGRGDRRRAAWIGRQRAVGRGTRPGRLRVTARDVQDPPARPCRRAPRRPPGRSSPERTGTRGRSPARR